MTNPTSNFGWQMPTSTDLVTDLPADFEVFGQAVDTSLSDLKGGTTGQILSKNSNTDMDFVWTTAAPGDITAVTAGTGISGGGTSGDVTITNSMATAITTAGDLIKGTGAGTFDRLGIGSTGQVLTVSSGAPAWVTPAGGGKVLQVVMGSTTGYTSNSTNTYADTNLSATITPSSTSSKILVLLNQNGVGKETTNTNAVIKLMRAATDLVTISKIGYTGSSAINSGHSVSLAYLDTPSTTSATTYKTRFLSVNNSSVAFVQDNDSGYPTTSTITLLEIGA